MKIKLDEKAINQILEDPKKASDAGVKVNDPWWVIVLKVISYLIGLVLAGAATASCSRLVGIV